MKYFCSKCGKTTAYNFELPKFCSACGQSFASTTTKSVPTNINKNELKFKQNNKQINIEDDILYNSEGHNLDNDQYKIAANFKNIKPAFKIDLYKPIQETVGSLLENPSKPIENIKSEVNTINRSDVDILEEFKREAGSLRQNE